MSADILKWLPTALFFLLTVLIVRFFQHRNSFPPGPFPLPIIGNLHLFISKTRYELITKLRSKYGDVFTVWNGGQPIVYIGGWTYIKEALVTQKNSFAGRPQSELVDVTLDHKESMVFVDPSPKRELTRKIAFAAIRKYVSSPRLEETVLHVFDAEINSVLDEKGPVNPTEFIDFVVMNIVANTAFGKRYVRSDPEFQEYNNFFENVPNLISKGIPGEFIPLLKPFLPEVKKKIHKLSRGIMKLFNNIYESHLKDFNGSVNDFTDAVISAKMEADPSDDVIKSLNGEDLYMIVFELFGAGVDTSRTTLAWTLLLLALNPKVQEKAFQEINDVYKGSLPTAADKDSCPYLQAVLKEVLRMRAPTPFGLTQKAMYDSTLGGHHIPAGTTVAFVYDSVHFDESYWKDPHQFRPERFVENPNLTKSHYMPFSLGRRNCIGEKMAVNQIFLILARLLQRSSFSLVGQGDITPGENAFFSRPRPYLLQFESRQV